VEVTSTVRAGIAAVTLAVVAFVAVLGAWLAGGGGFDIAWLPTWDARLAFRLDGLGALYALLATGIGVAVFTYATAYVPRHLEHEQRPQADGRRFHALMALFLVAMVGLATAQDLLLLFLFWDLTAIASYLLIGFDRQHREARLSALMALLVTGVSAVLLLIGILVLRAEYGTTSIPELLGRAAAGPAGPAVTLAGALIAVGALAKSAQAPLHFWLPRAMAAPTPVSAYLHSAAMVAAGVFLLSRLHPLLASSPALLDGRWGWCRWPSGACSRCRRTTSSGCSPTRPSPSTATWSPCWASAGPPGRPRPASTCWPTPWPRAPCS
jgi:multicomponent Na+:H+ antiporter subunit A